MLDPTSLSLIDRVKQRDEVAWKRLVDLYSRLLFYWCRHYDVPIQDRKDIVQDVFRVAFTSIDTFSKLNESDSFRAWLRSVAKARIFDYYRSKRNAHQTLSTSKLDFFALPQPNVNTEIPRDESDREDIILIRQAMRMVREKCEPETWDAFWSTTIKKESETSTEVGRRLNMKPSAVRQAKFRVIKMLRNEFEGLVSFDDTVKR